MLINELPVSFEGVILDFHSTLVDGGDPDGWIDSALRLLGRPDTELRPRLRAHLDQIWQHADTFDPKSERDLSSDRHRDVFRRAAALCPGADDELIAALYATMADQWVVFDDALPVLRELKSRGLRTLVLSNIGLDIRGCLARNGLAGLVDAVLLSYEVGVVKPDPAIFALALERLGTTGDRTLMVGDSARDDVGGAALGIRTLVLPRTRGPVHGLVAVARLI